MQIPTKISGFFTLGLAFAGLACSSNDQNYNAGTVYPAGVDMIPGDGSPPSAATPVQAAPQLTPEEVGPTINYTVKQGDSLWLIARNFKTSIGRLKAANQMEGDTILAGQTLKIPDQPGAAPAAAPATTPAGQPAQPQATPAPRFGNPGTTPAPPATPGAVPKIQDQ